MQLKEYYPTLDIAPTMAGDVLTVSHCSDYFVQQMQTWTQPETQQWLGMVAKAKIRPQSLLMLDQLPSIGQLEAEEAFKIALRQWRQRCQMALICANVNAYFPLSTLLELTSLMADEAIKVAHERAHRIISAQYGQAYRQGGKQAQSLSVLAMGKLGALELNLSSDIDLIFVYHFSGETQSSQHGQCISNQQYFLKVARKIIEYLDQKMANGFVYRVDMRLRPWGDSGQLVLNYMSFCKYYQSNARYWERFAMIKMRPVCGHPGLNQLLSKFVKHFVFRRYVDFQAKASLRQLKYLIEKEQARNTHQLDVKLSKGGIREIEFIVQALQLIHGGRQPLLQSSNIFTTLEQITHLHLLPPADVLHLTEAYCFLRHVEHAIQGVKDQQTQVLPSDQAMLQKVANSLAYQHIDELQSALERHMQWVGAKFNSLMHEKKQAVAIGSEFKEVLALIQHQHYDGPLLSAAFASMLQQLFKSKTVLALSTEVSTRLQHFILLLISQAQPWVTREDPQLTARLLTLIESILRRSSYLLMLSEHPKSFDLLANLCQRSAMLATMLAEKPFLLQQLLDANQLYQLQDHAALTSELRLQLLRIDAEDLELQMQVLRQFKHSQLFCAAACEVQSSLSIAQVSDYLSNVAEVILQAVASIARQQIEFKHGQPEQGAEDFSIIGYGKLAGRELNYHSDLDVVFIYAGAKGQTNGLKPIETSMFYGKIVQRMLHILTANTHYGRLYEIDMRLRPSGNSGPLVSNLQAFSNYQRKHAWLWEHQALIRSRFICGGLADEFNLLRLSVLHQPREARLVRAEVLAMREKMRQHLSQDQAECFDIKQGKGGLVDIEFIVQALLLQLLVQRPLSEIASDNKGLLLLLEKNAYLSTKQAADLQRAYLYFRQSLHFLALQQQPARVLPQSELPATQSWQKISLIRQNIEEIWHQIMLSSCE